MRKKETMNIIKYLYFTESRLLQAVKDCEYRYVRRALDSIDLLEEIVARERLRLFYDIEADIVKVLQLSDNYGSSEEEGT